MKFFVEWLVVIFCGLSFAKAETVVVCYRGGLSSETPESTLVCIQDYFSREIWGHEIDVRTTSDDELMILHDGTRPYLDIKVANAATVQIAVSEAEFDESKLTFLTFYNKQSTTFINEFPTPEVFQSLQGTS